MQAMVFESYAQFVENVVLPRKEANPSHRRLDGSPTGGNWAVAGVFRYEKREWKVHEDSHYEPLLIAYDAWKTGDKSPFVEEQTKRGTCLNLKPVLQSNTTTPRFKYLYIYEI